MNLEELDKLAKSFAEMPDGLDAPKQLLFLSLRSLYLVYRAKAIDIEMAKREKQEIIIAYDVNELRERIYKQHLEIYKTGLIMAKANKSDCDGCKEFVRLLTGIENNNPPPARG